MGNLASLCFMLHSSAQRGDLTRTYCTRSLSHGKYCFKSLKASSFISVQIRQFAVVQASFRRNIPDSSRGADVRLGADEERTLEFAGKSDV